MSKALQDKFSISKFLPKKAAKLPPHFPFSVEFSKADKINWSSYGEFKIRFSYLLEVSFTECTTLLILEFQSLR